MPLEYAYVGKITNKIVKLVIFRVCYVDFNYIEGSVGGVVLNNNDHLSHKLIIRVTAQY